MSFVRCTKSLKICRVLSRRFWNTKKNISYEVYRSRDKQYWYDDQPHPNDPSLQPNHPHHKHIHPDLKHHRIPTPNIHFDQNNLPFLIQEIIDEFLAQNA